MMTEQGAGKTIREIKEIKARFERESLVYLQGQMEKFKEETGVSIEDINISTYRISTFGEPGDTYMISSVDLLVTI